MTKRDVKERLLSALRNQGVEYRDRGGIVEFGDVWVLFDTKYINIKNDSASVHYSLSELSYISVLGGALWVGAINDYNFTIMHF